MIHSERERKREMVVTGRCDRGRVVKLCTCKFGLEIMMVCGPEHQSPPLLPSFPLFIRVTSLWWTHLAFGQNEQTNERTYGHYVHACYASNNAYLWNRHTLRFSTYYGTPFRDPSPPLSLNLFFLLFFSKLTLWKMCVCACARALKWIPDVEKKSIRKPLVLLINWDSGTMDNKLLYILNDNKILISPSLYEDYWLKSLDT